MSKTERDPRDHHLEKRGSTWFVRIRVPGSGKIYKRSLQTKDVNEARTRRKKHLDLILGGEDGLDQLYQLNSNKQTKHYPTFGELIRSYLAWAKYMNDMEQGPKLTTAKGAANHLIRLLAARHGFQPNSSGKAYGVPEQLESLPITEINKQLPIDYEEFYWRLARKNQRNPESSKISCSSAIRGARQVFGTKTKGHTTPMEWYEQQGLNLPPCIEEFKKTCGKYTDRGSPYEKPPQDLITKTMAAAEELKRDNPAVAAAFVLAYDFGLRPSEAVWAKWDWFNPRDDGSVSVKVAPEPRIIGDDGWVGPKHKPRGRTIAVPMQTFEWLRDNLWGDNAPKLGDKITKLDFDKAQEIRRRVGKYDRHEQKVTGTGETHTALAEEFGVSVKLVGKVISNEIWTEPAGSVQYIPTGATGEYILPGLTYSARHDLIRYDLNAWMRSLGWSKKKYEKASYELRKLRGSEYYVKLGSVQARNFLGHSSVSTTEWYYAALGDQEVQALYPEALPPVNPLFDVA